MTARAKTFAECLTSIFPHIFYRSTTTSAPPVVDIQEDPCLEGNHIVIANEPERSANHHLSLGAISSPICDRTILPGWYRFQSPAGNLIPTECPGENYCGTRKPVWLNGKLFLKPISCPIERQICYFI